jgi:hypothetical protein
VDKITKALERLEKIWRANPKISLAELIGSYDRLGDQQNLSNLSDRDLLDRIETFAPEVTKEVKEISKGEVAICGSRCFHGTLIKVQETLQVAGISSSLPEYEGSEGFLFDDDRWKERINKEDTKAILVINLSRDDVHGYIGANVMDDIQEAHMRPHNMRPKVLWLF